MKQGDFTELAKFYVDRPGYSIELLSYIRDHIMKKNGIDHVIAADVGAGTGKLTENLEQIGVTGFAVEPNDAMRAEGEKLFSGRNTFTWKKGAAEETSLSSDSVNWVLMGSSFHWADAPRASAEFQRILKPGGFFTAIWNPREIARSPLHQEIEDMIYREVKTLKRVSSGSTVTTDVMEEKLGARFRNIVFQECRFEELMSKERYMNIWRSVNDIQAQAGEEGFKRILSNIEDILGTREQVAVPYKARSWTAEVVK